MERYVAMLRTDIDDKDITEWALDEIGSDINVKFIADADELDQLVVSSGTPSLILLNDTGAAHIGYERLTQLKLNPAYNHIPVILLGEISTDDYIRKCYRAGANSFIIKPSTVAEAKKKISLFFDYWLNVAAL